MRKVICSIVCALLLVSCGEYNKILKSTDYELKYDYAKKAFERKKYMQAATLLEELVAIFKGTDRAEESLYLLARSYYLNKDYITSGEYFQAYYKNYPKGEYTELARFYCGYGYYLDSPEAKLDQTGTYRAIDEMQRFLDYFPNSERAKQAQDIIFELHVFAGIALGMMMVGALGMNIVPKEYFGIVERFSVFAATGFQAVLGMHLYRMELNN